LSQDFLTPLKIEMFTNGFGGFGRSFWTADPGDLWWRNALFLHPQEQKKPGRSLSPSNSESLQSEIHIPEFAQNWSLYERFCPTFLKVTHSQSVFHVLHWIANRSTLLWNSCCRLKCQSRSFSFLLD
jgi:hypothetical protein